MTECLNDKCDNPKTTGSGWCLKHWISHKYAPILGISWVAGFFTAYDKYLFWVGFVVTLSIVYLYTHTGREVESLQESMQKHGLPDVDTKGGEG